MSPLYIKMRPEDNVTVDMRDLTPSESLIVLDYATCASHSRTDSSGSALEYVVHNTAPEHDNDENMQTVCDSHQPSSSNELSDKSKDNHSNEMCNPETSVESAKTDSLTDTSENEIKYSNIDHCDTSQMVTSECNSECADLNLSVPQNIAACSVQSPDSSTTVDGITKLPDKPQKLILNKEKLGKVQKPKTKFNVHNFIKSTARKKTAVVQEIPEHSDITENTLSNVDSEKEISNLKIRDTKSKRKIRKISNPAVTEPSTIESKTKLRINEQNILEDTKDGRKKVTKSVQKPKINLDKNKDAVSEESRTEHLTDTEEKSLLGDVEYPEDTHMGRSKRKSTSKLKQQPNSVESDELVEPAVPVNVMNAIDKKNKKNKPFLKENRRINKKSETKLKWKMKLRNHVLTKVPRKYVLEDISDEEESSTSEVSSKLDESEMTKNNDVSKKTDKEDMQKDFDNIFGNHTGKAKLKKENKLDGNRETTVPTEHFDVQSKSKLADKKQNSKLENLELNLPTLPVTIEMGKLKKIPKLSKKCKTNLKNEEQRAPSKEFEVKGNPKKIVEQENSALKNVKLPKNWNVRPLSPIQMTTETLQQRWAETGLIAPLHKNSYNESKRRRSQLPRICNDELKLQNTSETLLFDNQNTKEKALVNPLANVSTPLTEFRSSLDKNKQFESYSVVPGITKLPISEETLTYVKSHEMIQPTRQISFDTSKETTIADEHFVVDGITEIMPSTENTASNNCAMPSREVNLQTPFLIPSLPRRKRIRVNMNTNIEKQTLPSKTNIDYDSYEDAGDGMEKEMQNTSEECSARNKHSFNFVDITARPTQTKRTRKVKITRPDMSDIVSSNVKREPREDDSISIYADSLRNGAMSVTKYCDLDDKDNKVSPSYLNRNDNVRDWIRHTRRHVTDNATPQNTNNIQIEERISPSKHPKINNNMFVEDEVLPPISNSVIDTIETTKNITKRPCNNLDTLYVFDGMCRNVMEDGICKKLKCGFHHTLPRDWEITLQNMPQESVQNLYNNIKNRMNLYIFKKIFPIVVKLMVLQRDFNSVISLVKDVLEINLESDRTPYINVVIDAMHRIGMTFSSAIDVIFNSTVVERNLKDQLTDILINICIEQDDIANNWSTLQLLMKYRNYHLDDDIIKTILKKCMTKSKLQKELCLKVYSDLISCISDDQLGTRFECILNDYIECMRTLGFLNEAQALYERFVALSVRSSRSSRYMPTGNVCSKFVPEVSPIIPLFNIKYALPPKLSPPPTFTQIAKHNSPPNCNARYRRPIANTVMSCNKIPDLLLKDVLVDKQPSNVPSTSATVAPYVEEIQTYSLNTVKQAILTENLPQLMSLIRKYKEGDLTDEFLKACVDAMQESAHNSAVLYRNLCKSATDFKNEQDAKMNKSLEYVFQTIGYNLIIYSANNNEWEQAYNIYQTLQDLYNNSDIKNIKMFMVDQLSYNKRLLIICRIFVKHADCRYAWELFRVNNLHTSSCWTDDADQQDIQYRDLVFTELMTGLNKEKQWETTFTIIEYILKNNINELDPIVDTTIQMAVRNDCDAEYIISSMSVCPLWYSRIHCHTFRVIVVKLVRAHMYRMARTVYKQGCEMKIYPHLYGNEKCLVFSTHYVVDEIILMLKVFLQNMVNFMPVRHTLVIKVHQSAEVIDETGKELPSLLYQDNVSYETMRVRIVNILNNFIKPPIRVVNKYSHLEITPAELEKHLEVRRKCNQFC